MRFGWSGRHWARQAKRTIKSGIQSRLFVANTSSNAIKGLVSGLITDVCGVNVEIRGACRVLGNGLLLNDMKIGTDMTVRGVFLRAQLEPLIAVLKSWQVRGLAPSGRVRVPHTPPL